MTTHPRPDYSTTHRVGGGGVPDEVDLATLAIGPVRSDKRGRMAWSATWTRPAHRDTYGQEIPAGAGSLTLRTNADGCGLWLVSDAPGREDKQIRGTLQFTLTGSAGTRRRHAVAAMLDALGAEPIEQW
jgi:hypothetical protein